MVLDDDADRATGTQHQDNLKRQSLPFLHRNMLNYGREATFELIVKSKSTTGVILRIAGGTRSSLISTRHETATDGTITTTTHNIDDFPIFLSVDDPDLTDDQGETFVSVSLRINKDISLPLMSGSVYELKPLTYPSNTMRDPMPNRGEIGIVQSADPAAGSNASITIDNDEIWRIIWASIQLATDGTAATRRLHLRFTPDTAGEISTFSDSNHTANITRQYSFVQFGEISDSLDSTKVLGPMPSEMWMEPSTVIAAVVINIQSGDDLTPLVIMREKFYTGT